MYYFVPIYQSSYQGSLKLGETTPNTCDFWFSSAFFIVPFWLWGGNISFTKLRGQKSSSIPFCEYAWFVTRTVTSVVEILSWGKFSGDLRVG